MRISRPPACLAFALALLLLPIVGAQAQSASDAAPANRAVRDAENPMRMIIEAGKLKVRSRPDTDPADAATATADKRAPAARTAPAKVAAPARSASSAVAKAPPGAAPEAADRPAERAPEPPLEALVSTTAESPAATPAPPELLPPLRAAARPAPLVPLKLLNMVEPSLRESALRRLRSDVEVVVDFVVNPDGSVSNVAVRSSPMPTLDADIVEAVAQWRYQPIAEPRMHGVQLLLRKPR